jgi:SulP family sulfate permease
VEVYEIDGPLFFGAAETFKNTLGQVARRPRVLVVRLRHVPAIDSTGLFALRGLHRRCRREGTRLLLSDVQEQPRAALARSGLLDELGAGQVFASLDEALEHARGEIASA